jgi:hypothetical protein
MLAERRHDFRSSLVQGGVIGSSARQGNEHLVVVGRAVGGDAGVLQAGVVGSRADPIDVGLFGELDT